jgi:hypothetical protein
MPLGITWASVTYIFCITGFTYPCRTHDYTLVTETFVLLHRFTDGCLTKMFDLILTSRVNAMKLCYARHSVPLSWVLNIHLRREGLDDTDHNDGEGDANSQAISPFNLHF